MVEIAERLQSFLQEAESMPLVWGESDCSKWPARWVETARGVKVPLPSWSSRDEAHALIATAGSLVALWDDALAAAGIYEAGVPHAGDVGIIDSHLAGQCGGIFIDENFFAWRAEPQGYRILRPRRNTIVKAWSLQ